MDQHRQAAIDERIDELVALTGRLPAADRLVALDRAVSRLQAALAASVADLDSEGSLERSGCRSAGSWVRLHLRRAGSGFRLVRRSALLPALPGFAAAFAAGQVNEEHLDTLARWVKTCGLDAIRAHEATLLELAKQASASELAAALEVLADVARPDRDADKVAALADRFITIRGVGDLVHVDAMVEPALGEALQTAVEAGATPPAGVRPGDDGRTLAQRRADAFGELVLRGIEANAADQSGNGRLRPQVAVTVSLEWLAGLPGAPRPLLAHFGVLPAPTAHRLVCDGDLARVVLDAATGLPLNVGRLSRLAVKRQRRALAAIFRHCAFPGCQVPFRFCEIHHRDWWCAGGATDLALLVPYCWTHHHFLHEYGFTVDTDAAGRLIHRRPDGALIPDPDHPLRAAVDQLRLDVERNGGPARTRTLRTPWPAEDERPPPDAA
jgi:Domain of unknown function (DUF222)